YVPDPRIPLPRDIYPDRKNSLGLDLARRDVLDSLHQRILAEKLSPPPASTPRQVLDSAIARAVQSFEAWSRVPAAERAAVWARATPAAPILQSKPLALGFSQPPSFIKPAFLQTSQWGSSATPRWARPWWPIRASPASPSPARSRPRSASISRWHSARGRS